MLDEARWRQYFHNSNNFLLFVRYNLNIMYIIYFKLYPELSKKKEKLNTLIQRYEFKNNFPRIGRKFRSFKKYQKASDHRSIEYKKKEKLIPRTHSSEIIFQESEENFFEKKRPRIIVRLKIREKKGKKNRRRPVTRLIVTICR